MVPPLLLLLFCGTISHACADVYPSGVDSHAIVSGVYPGSDVGSCCWLKRTARIMVAVPANADTLVVTIFIPAYSIPSGQTEAVQAQIASGPTITACCLGAGIHELAFPVPQLKKRSALITLRISHTFVPAQVGFVSDTRQLSVLLRGIEWRNTIGGAVTTPLDPGIARALIGLYALIFIVVVFGTFRRPILGAALLIVSSPFALYVPLGNTTLTLPKVIVIAVALGLLPRLKAAQSGAHSRAATLLVAQGLVALVVLASLHNATFHAPVWREFFKEVQYGATALVAYLAIRVERSQNAVVWTRVALESVMVLVSIAALVQERAGAPMGVYLAGHSLARIAGPLEGPNQLAAFLGVALIPVLAFALTQRRPQIDIAVLAFGFVAALLTFSRGGVTALLVAIVLTFVALRAVRFKRIAYTLFGIIFAAAFLLACFEFAGMGSSLGRVAFGAAGGSETFNGGLGTRAQLWHGAYVLWRSHPWLGVGAGNYELEVSRTGAPGVRTHANSAYFQALAEEGILGFIALFLVAFASVRLFAGGNGVLSVAMLAVVLALWFHQITDYVTFYPKVGVLLWTMLGIGAATRAEN